MIQAEIDSWAHAATLDQAHAVRNAVVTAHADWLQRIAGPAELHDLALISITGLVWPAIAARAAGAAAAETAILVAIWPRPIDQALGRPTTNGRGPFLVRH